MSESKDNARSAGGSVTVEGMPRSALRGIFAGQVAEEYFAPFPRIDPDEQENLELALDSFRQWADENLDPVAIDRDQEIPPEVRRGLGELGVMGFTIPEEYEGFGFSNTAYCRLMEEIGRRDGSLAVFLGAHQSIGSKGLVLFGSEEQKRHWLPRVATGEAVAAYALTEPGAGSDTSAIKTRALWNEEKGCWVLNGNKIWITNGGYADIFTVFAQTSVPVGDRTRDMVSAFLLERGQPGFSNGPSEHKLGIRGSSTVELAFENVEVPAENMLGEPGRGVQMALDILQTGRLTLAAGCIGASKELLRLALQHAMERRQFGAAIADLEPVRRKLSTIASETYAMEAMVYLSAGLADRGESDISMETAACKVFCSEAGWRAVNHALQAVGGIGYMVEYPYERALRDARINLIFEGTNEVLRMLVALGGLRRRASLLRPDTSPSRPLSDWVAPSLAAEADVLGQMLSGLAGAATEALARHRSKIVRRGYLHERFADAAIDLYAVGAVLSRVSSRVSAEGEEAAARDILLGRTFCADALGRVEKILRDLGRADDALHDGIAELLKERSGYPTPLL